MKEGKSKSLEMIAANVEHSTEANPLSNFYQGWVATTFWATDV